jgi:AcrR family transcriptional regulator
VAGAGAGAARHGAGGTRGEQTKQLIVSTALRLFRERGYEETTMRAIAAEAGLAVGNAYYYFASKEHLIQAFYEEIGAATREAAAPALDGQKDFAARLAGVMHAGISVMEPYHAFAGKFFRSAAEPASPLNPFSAESSPSRDASVALFREVLAGSDAKPHRQVREELPELLWLAYMGVILFWVHDASPEQEKTRLLIDRVVPMIDRLVGLSRLPVLRAAARDFIDLIGALKH